MKAYKILTFFIIYLGLLFFITLVHESVHVVHLKLLNPEVQINEICIFGGYNTGEKFNYGGFTLSEQDEEKRTIFEKSHPEFMANIITVLIIIILLSMFFISLYKD